MTRAGGPGGQATEVAAKATRRRFTAASTSGRSCGRPTLHEAGRARGVAATGGAVLLAPEALAAARQRGELAGLRRRSAARRRSRRSARQADRRARARDRRLPARAGRAPRRWSSCKKNGGAAGDAARRATRRDDGDGHRDSRRGGVAATCAALGCRAASYYRRRRSTARAAAAADARPRALRGRERRRCSTCLHEPRFVDLAPAEVYATLLDEGALPLLGAHDVPLLAAHAEVRERRDQLRHPRYAKPELLATRPNQVWSWDITKLLGPAKWTYFYLYVHARHLQSLRRRLDGRRTRERDARRAAHRRDLRHARRSRPASSPSTPTAARR